MELCSRDARRCPLVPGDPHTDAGRKRHATSGLARRGWTLSAARWSQLRDFAAAFVGDASGAAKSARFGVEGAARMQVVLARLQNGDTDAKALIADLREALTILEAGAAFASREDAERYASVFEPYA